MTQFSMFNLVQVQINFVDSGKCFEWKLIDKSSLTSCCFDLKAIASHHKLLSSHTQRDQNGSPICVFHRLHLRCFIHDSSRGAEETGENCK
ncbi:unnamed protein product [Phyllotreta striolata]|uniref:Uncharacterized protein n=1 Tax=Phyllotreta striolata TaxID=444603 RepID=A0A9N9XRP2_PHYSR|nr:unnamed protein product [Phyllotreta striolata]